MKYGPIFKQIDELFGDSAIGHFFLFNSLNVILPRAWHLRRELYTWKKKKVIHQHILDAGSGLGQNAYMLSGMVKTWGVHGIDIDSKLVAHSNKVFRKLKRENVLFSTSDMCTSVTENAYDLILGMDIAEFVADDECMFENFRKSLRENGALMLYTHLIDEKNPHRKRARHKIVEEQVRNGYRTDEIRAKLKAAGFTRVKIRYVFGVAGYISWNLAVLYPLWLMNLSFFSLVVLPFYYGLLLPLILILNYIETHTGHLTGTAMFIKAFKD